jgi:hypothetical protein
VVVRDVTAWSSVLVSESCVLTRKSQVKGSSVNTSRALAAAGLQA